MLKKLMKNDYFFSVLTKVAMVFIAFVHSIVLARFLGPTLKGIHATIYSIMSIGSVIINLSTQQAYPYFRKKYGYENYFNKFMSFSYIYHLIFEFIAILIAINIYSTSLIWAMSILLIPINSLSTVIGYVCLIEYPRERNKALLIIELLDTLYVSILFLFSNANSIYVLIVFLIPILLKIIYFTYKNKFKFSIKSIDRKFIIELFRYSWFPMLSMLLTMLNYKIDIFMLKSNEFITLSQIGIYSIGVSLAEKVVYIPDAIKEILLSKLANGKGSKEVVFVMRLCFPITLLVAFLIFILGEPVISLLYGNEYRGAYVITIICVLGISMMVFFKMISQYNNVNGKQKINVLILTISIIVNVILNCFLIPRYEIIGAGIATLISYMVCASVFLIYFKNISKTTIRNMIFPTKEDINRLKDIIKIKRKW